MARMQNSSILIIAIGSAFFAFFITLRFLNTGKSMPLPQNRLQVVGAIRDIELGSTVQKDDVDLLTAPSDINPKVLFTEFNSVVGKISRRNIPKGEIIKSVDLLAEGDNLANLIPEGYRAMTIPATVPPNMRTLVQTGNRIDILLTYQNPSGDIESMTLVENAKVIGVSGSPTGNQADITLAVTPVGAETLAYSQKKGSMTVTVRPYSDAERREEKFYSLKELFMKKSAEKMLETTEIQVIRGLTVKKESTRYGATVEAGSSGSGGT